jgi:hypothetical protein
MPPVGWGVVLRTLLGAACLAGFTASHVPQHVTCFNARFVLGFFCGSGGNIAFFRLFEPLHSSCFKVFCIAVYGVLCPMEHGQHHVSLHVTVCFFGFE